MANPIEFFQDFLKNIKNIGLEYYQKYYSFYPGIVVDNNDPEKRGRIKVELPTILGTKKLHARWVEPLNAALGSKGIGNLDVPYLKQIVNVGFFYGNLNQPFYIGGSYAKEELPEDFKANYPNVRGWVFASGQKIIIDETKDKQSITILNTDGSKIVFSGEKDKEVISLIHKQGSQAVFNEKGEVVVSDKGGKEILTLKDGEASLASGGKIVHTAGADYEVTATGNIKASGQEVAIEAKAKAEFKGTAGTDVGSDASATNLNGSTVIIAKGALPAARLLSQGIGVGNLSGPVLITIIDGSPKVLIP